MIYNFKLIQNPRSIPSRSDIVPKKYWKHLHTNLSKEILQQRLRRSISLIEQTSSVLFAHEAEEQEKSLKTFKQCL